MKSLNLKRSKDEVEKDENEIYVVTLQDLFALKEKGKIYI